MAEVNEFLASKREGGSGDEGANPEEEVKGEWKIADLPEVEVKTGEENCDVLLQMNAKLYRWNDNQWKERGTGEFKLLKNRVSNKISFVMRQALTFKLVASFSVDSFCTLVPHSGSDRAWVWMAYDTSDGEPTTHRFAMRLGSAEEARTFKDAFDEARESNASLAPKTEEEKKDD